VPGKYYSYGSAVFVDICVASAMAACCNLLWMCVARCASCNTQTNAPEDGRVRRPKHVEIIGILIKPLLLHQVVLYIIYINYARSNKYQIIFFFWDRSRKTSTAQKDITRFFL
jgi:hypothetical protein